jgi:hypothetical protein
VIQQRTFDELIEGLDPFDRRMTRALKRLRVRQDAMTIQTSRFELCRLLGVAYDADQAARIDESLASLERTLLRRSGPQSGFSIAARAVNAVRQEGESEKLTILLGRLYAR